MNLTLWVNWLRALADCAPGIYLMCTSCAAQRTNSCSRIGNKSNPIFHRLVFLHQLTMFGCFSRTFVLCSDSFVNLMPQKQGYTAVSPLRNEPSNLKLARYNILLALRDIIFIADDL